MTRILSVFKTAKAGVLNASAHHYRGFSKVGVRLMSVKVATYVSFVQKVQLLYIRFNFIILLFHNML